MNIFDRMHKGITPTILVLALGFTVLADTVRLKDGGIIKGKVVGFNGGSFVISVGEGSRKRELRFAASEVENVQFDSPGETVSKVAAPNQSVLYKEPVSRNEAKAEKADRPATGRAHEVPSVDNSRSPGPGPIPRSDSGSMKPVELKVRVLADNTANGWTNSGWIVKKGQRIRIIADDGTVSLGKGKTSTAAGDSSFEDDRRLLRGVPTGALLAVIGDDNNDFIYVGSEREFTATRDGALYLGINDGDLNDNSGAFNVKIEILPDKT